MTFILFVSKMLTSSNTFFESFYFRKSHFLIRCSNPEFTFLNTDIFSNTLLPIFPTFFSNFTCFIIESEEKNITWLNWTLFLSNLLKEIWNTRIETFFTDLVCYLLFLLHLANFALQSHLGWQKILVFLKLVGSFPQNCRKIQKMGSS